MVAHCQHEMALYSGRCWWCGAGIEPPMRTVMRRVQFVTVKVDSYPMVTSVHGITKGQRLRVVAKIPASQYTYDEPAVVLDAEDGRDPIVLWERQIAEAVK
jgi:hypothetical protein